MLPCKTGNYYVVHTHYADLNKPVNLLVYIIGVKQGKALGEVLAADQGSGLFVDDHCSINLSEEAYDDNFSVEDVPRNNLPLFIGWPLHWSMFEKHLKGLSNGNGSGFDTQ